MQENQAAAASAPDRAGRLHLPYLDGVRALAAIYVLLHHAVGEVYEGRMSGLDAKTLLLTYPMGFGHFAVCLFIVLSGFCLMIPVLRNQGTLKGGAKRFYLRRAHRILPTYYAAVGFSLLLIYTLVGKKMGTHWDGSTVVTWSGLLTRLLMLQDLYDDGQINHVFWSVAVEWKIYFLFPLLILAWKRFGARWVAAVTCIAAVAVTFAFDGRSILFNLRPHFLALFVFGMIAAAVVFTDEEKWRRLQTRLPWGILTLGATFLLWATNYMTRKKYINWQWVVMDLIAGVASAALLVYVSTRTSSRTTRLLSWPPLVFIGTFAYSIYLIHGPLLQVVWQYGLRPLHLGDKPTLLLLYGVGTPLIVGVAYLFFLAFERPFLNTPGSKKGSPARAPVTVTTPTS